IGAVHAINKPSEDASNCAFEVNAVNFGGGKISRDGLPSFISNYFINQPILAADTCEGDSTSFSYLQEFGDSVIWNFGDGTGPSNKSNLLRPKHKYVKPGRYTVLRIDYFDGKADTTATSVMINALPQFTLGPDTTICGGAQYFLNPAVSNAQYLWQDGKTTPVCPVKASGTYHVKVTRYACTSFDTVHIVLDEPVTAIVVQSNAQCENNNGFNFQIKQTDRVATAMWTFGDGDISALRQTSHSYAAAGIYEVKLETVNDKGCKASDQISVEVFPIVSSAFTVNQDAQCFGQQSFELDGQEAGNPELQSYSFTFSDTRRYIDIPVRNHKFLNAGTYWVRHITTSIKGCKDTTQQNLVVRKDPLIHFVMDSSAHCVLTNNIIVEDISSSENGSILSRQFESEG
ncbi:MAG: PKD domain-containing protein, partial [Bacteroidota bacterium]|nr:PKD domain-containing protein [Bacteroidota bacterium]MDX5430269.1 PKD domain-containing protein [Bacteroidota bacterium]MDX5469030.1 PKD domain-containing protein [Bacteroidota bacterium]